MMRTMILALALLAILSSSARAVSSQAGTSGAQFLKLGAGARAGGMADAFTAVADDPYAAYYNPAGLSQLTGPQLAGAHTSYFQSVSYEVITFAYPFNRSAEYSADVLDLSIYQLSVGDIPQYSSDSTDPVGTFGASDGAYAISYAHGFNRRLSLGGTAKLITESISTFHSSAYSFDGGVLYHMNPDGSRPVSLAATVRNLGSSRTGYIAGNSDPLPTSYSFAGAMQIIPKTLILDAEVTRYRDTNAFAAFGGEFNHKINDAIGSSFRMGYTSQYNSTPGLNGIAAGAGVSFKKASFDFAWQPFGVLGNTFRYSLNVKF